MRRGSLQIGMGIIPALPDPHLNPATNRIGFGNLEMIHLGDLSWYPCLVKVN